MHDDSTHGVSALLRRRRGPCERLDQLITLEPRLGSVFWPIIGFLIAPRTTVMWVIVAPGGVRGLAYLWLGLAIALDIAT